MSTPPLLARYLDGDRDGVWAALRVGADGDEAQAVAAEAMHRARANVATLVERLSAAGYRFGDPNADEGATAPLALPDAHTPTFLAWLGERFGPIPATVKAWIAIVGDVSLLGVHPRWAPELVTDPLVVEFELKSWPSARSDRGFARLQYEAEHEQWLEDGGEESGRFVLPVAPDALHKANISGGAPYGVEVPDVSVDATFRFEDGKTLPFIEYLRLTFRHGGFPGLATRRHSATVAAEVRELADGLLQL